MSRWHDGCNAGESRVLDTYFKQYFWTFHLAVLFGAALLVGKTVNAFVGRALAPSAEKLALAASRAPQGNEKATTELAPLTELLDRNIFKAMREDLTPVAEETPEEAPPTDSYDRENCPRSSMSTNLVATIVGSKSENSAAVFQDPGEQKVVVLRVEEQLLSQAVVKEIEWRSVRVERQGHCELFSLEEPNPNVSDAIASNIPPPPPPPPSGDPGELGQNVKQVSASEYEIPREEIDKVLSNLNQIATQARIVPSFQNGQANGFKLFSIRPNSLYAKIGIQNGDVIQRINGFEINSPDKALEIYTKLKDASSISVDLIRRGKTQSLSYSIR